jgi:hypothetical protein
VADHLVVQFDELPKARLKIIIDPIRWLRSPC